MDEFAVPVKTRYESVAVDVPEDFLTQPPENPVRYTKLDFAASEIPEYDGSMACIVENVLSPEECRQLIAFAEASVPKETSQDPAWRPALVNAGGGYEVAIQSYRNSDRIIWDNQDMVDRIWSRCSQAEGLTDILIKPPPDAPQLSGTWEFLAWNKRMRFLKYTPGQYFKPHYDGAYSYFEGGAEVSTIYTVQLYLNDSMVASPTDGEYSGGATSFLSGDESRRVDVSPKAGSVLIFQHNGLRHEGAEVLEGTKFAMRTDILYKFRTRHD